MIYGFEIADIPFVVESPFPLVEGEHAGKFRKEVPFSSFFSTVSLCEGFGAPKGKRVLDDYLTRLYLDGNDITNDQIYDPAGRVLFRSHYTMGCDHIPIEVENSATEYLTQDKLWSTIDLPFQLLARGALVLHSTSVDIGGRVILFSAPSGVGKSTQAGLWEKYRGAKQLNGDKNAMRLRDGVPYAFGLPFCGTSKICHPYALPIAAIVLLSQAPENTVRRLRFAEALAKVAGNCVGHNTIPGTVGRITDTVIGIVSRVPVYHLACTPDERAVKTLEEVIS